MLVRLNILSLNSSSAFMISADSLTLHLDQTGSGHLQISDSECVILLYVSNHHLKQMSSWYQRDTEEVAMTVAAMFHATSIEGFEEVYRSDELEGGQGKVFRGPGRGAEVF